MKSPESPDHQENGGKNGARLLHNLASAISGRVALTRISQHCWCMVHGLLDRGERWQKWPRQDHKLVLCYDTAA